MKLHYCAVEEAEAANNRFEKGMSNILKKWVYHNADSTFLRFNQPLHEYIAGNALRDYFLNTQYPVLELLKNRAVFRHLSRPATKVYFDPITGDPLLARSEQRIYNFARRLDSESMHVPFRSVHPAKQTECGDIADINTYPPGSEEIRYNSGNHFASRPANMNVFNENSKRCLNKAGGNFHVLFKRGFLEDRLQDVKIITTATQAAGRFDTLFFLICSRHSLKEGHYGVSLVIMDPANPYFPQRVMVCDTLLKELPHHPRWWNSFIEEYSNIFGSAVAEIIEDLSHPLQKVNIKGEEPYRHDWDCPYYTAVMANALAELANRDQYLLLKGSIPDIHFAMRTLMAEYYKAGGQIKDRQDIRQANTLKRWKSGRELIKSLAKTVNPQSFLEL